MGGRRSKPWPKCRVTTRICWLPPNWRGGSVSLKAIKSDHDLYYFYSHKNTIQIKRFDTIKWRFKNVSGWEPSIKVIMLDDNCHFRWFQGYNLDRQIICVELPHICNMYNKSPFPKHQPKLIWNWYLQLDLLESASIAVKNKGSTFLPIAAFPDHFIWS